MTDDTTRDVIVGKLDVQDADAAGLPLYLHHVDDTYRLDTQPPSGTPRTVRPSSIYTHAVTDETEEWADQVTIRGKTYDINYR